MDRISFSEGGPELLDVVAPLWERQRQHHVEISRDFRDVFAATTFAKRCAAIEGKTRSGGLRIDVARDETGGECIGYCISTVDREGVGEVESIFVEAAYRSRGLGSALLKKALAWMDAVGAREKRAYVAAGNERAISLYRRVGFVPKNTLLVQK